MTPHQCLYQRLSRSRDGYAIACPHMTFFAESAFALITDSCAPAFVVPFRAHRKWAVSALHTLPCAIPYALLAFLSDGREQLVVPGCQDAPPVSFVWLRQYLWWHCVSDGERVLADQVQSKSAAWQYRGSTYADIAKWYNAYAWSKRSCWPATGACSLPWWEEGDPTPAALIAAHGDWTHAKHQGPVWTSEALSGKEIL